MEMHRRGSTKRNKTCGVVGRMENLSRSFRLGAEAVLTIGEWRGRRTVIKERICKGYRHPSLDRMLRAERLKNEARLFLAARKLGVSVPIVYKLDLEVNRIIMEYIDGRQAKEIINDPSIPEKDKINLCRLIGGVMGKLHSGGITHGDPTTSNMIVRTRSTGRCKSDRCVLSEPPRSGKRRERLYLIDFSMGYSGADTERMGVDMHLLRESFQSAHSEYIYMFSHIESAYMRSFVGAKDVLRKVVEIEERGRYARHG